MVKFQNNQYNVEHQEMNAALDQEKKEQDRINQEYDQQEKDIQDQINQINEEQEQEGESISKFVNQEYANQLQNMGFTKNVAEKALFMTQAQGGTIEKALEWIDQHSEDPDFQEELKIVGKDENAKPKSNLSKEEKLKRAKELQQAIRKKREEEEKKLEEERERNRIKFTKEMSETKRKMEEQQLKLELDRQKKEKQEFMDAKKRMLEQLERDKQERFGKKATTSTTASQPVVQQKKNPIEVIKHGLKMVRTLYTEDRNPGIAKTCLKTCHVYLSNILKNPQEEKFKKINLQNETFQKKVGKINGGLSILKGAGFEDQPDGTLVMKTLDEKVIQEAVRLIENNM